MIDMQRIEQQLESLRRGGDPDDLAEALVASANLLVERGELPAARRNLEEAAEIHRQRGRAYDQARCAQFAATLCRLGGDLDAAEKGARRVLQLVEPGSPIAISALTELGEVSLARRWPAAAVEAYRQALAGGSAAGLSEASQASLLRKRAVAYAMGGQYEAAAQDLAVAYQYLVQLGDRPTALRVLIEQATAFHGAGDRETAEQVCATAMRDAQKAGDHQAQADLRLLQAALAVAAGNLEVALQAAKDGRELALRAIAPISYISAATTIAELSEALGDRLATYEALAVGWVTLGDLLGRDVAETTFQPKLLALRERWGASTFAQIKAAYEEHRRAHKRQ